jgi:hypothetical protein
MRYYGRNHEKIPRNRAVLGKISGRWRALSPRASAAGKGEKDVAHERGDARPARCTRYNARMSYHPQPVDTASIELSLDILELTEMLAKNAHEVWAKERMAQGWRFGSERNDARKEHPSLIPYEQLPESEKIYDRNTAIQTLKAIVASGYRITKA